MTVGNHEIAHTLAPWNHIARAHTLALSPHAHTLCSRTCTCTRPWAWDAKCCTTSPHHARASASVQVRARRRPRHRAAPHSRPGTQARAPCMPRLDMSRTRLKHARVTRHTTPRTHLLVRWPLERARNARRTLAMPLRHFHKHLTGTLNHTPGVQTQIWPHHPSQTRSLPSCTRSRERGARDPPPPPLTVHRGPGQRRTSLTGAWGPRSQSQTGAWATPITGPSHHG